MKNIGLINTLFPLVSNPSSNGEKVVTRESILEYGLILFQLGLLVATIWMFQIEREHGFPLIAPVIFVGFAVYHFLPIRFRLPFFFALSLVGFAVVAGVLNTLLVVGIGLALLGLCHLPVKQSIRVALVSLAAILLVLCRLNWIKTPKAAVVIPIVASMFMFRLILYLHEMGQKNQEKATVWQRITYFFMLPNICFPLFPIVDWKTYVRSYYSREPLQILQKGIIWIFYGVLQLLAYRVIYYFYTPAPSDVTTLSSLILYLVTSYMLVLRIAGGANVVVGILCLFGFDLPAIFSRYFLASGFNDLWRRINIYWKDFVTKIFYYRLYFVFKKWGLQIATACTLFIVFLITWLLHSYQFFWLIGRFPITVVDGLFWGIFGVLVTVNSLMQMKQKPRKTLGARRWSFREAFKTSLRVVLFFLFMCMLWSVWLSDSVGEWMSTVSVIRNSPVSEIGLIPLAIIGLSLLGAFLQYPFQDIQKFSLFNQKFYRTAFVVSMVLLLTLTIRMYRYYLPTQSKVAKFVYAIREPRLNRKDADVKERGYYEPLLNRSPLSEDIASDRGQQPLDWQQLEETSLARSTNNILLLELVPSKHVKFKGALLNTNQWGMRDKEYEKAKPPGTYRFALLGGSLEMGSGVADQETFEAIVENWLNEKQPTGLPQRYEILNFSVGGYDLIRNVKVMEMKVPEFQPDAVLLFAHTSELGRTIYRFIEILEKDVNLEYDFLERVRSESGVQKDMVHSELVRRLRPYSEKIFEWALKRQFEICKEHKVLPILVFLPAVADQVNEREVNTFLSLAHKIGFETFDLSTVYAGHDNRTLQVASWDTHPNIKGHRLIADLLYKRILEKKDLFDANRSSDPQTTSIFKKDEYTKN